MPSAEADYLLARIPHRSADSLDVTRAFEPPDVDCYRIQVHGKGVTAEVVARVASEALSSAFNNCSGAL
jgi:hypothetical protein